LDTNKQAHPADTDTISNNLKVPLAVPVMAILNSFVSDIFEHIATEASSLLHIDNTVTPLTFTRVSSLTCDWLMCLIILITVLSGSVLKQVHPNTGTSNKDGCS